MRTAEYDAIVVGAGPAGCAAARLLAAWSHRVLLVDRAGSANRTLAESIPPSTQKILATLGMLPAVEDAGFHRWTGNTVWWAGAAPRVEAFASGMAGYQVIRGAFDATLVSLARESGAEVRQGVVKAADPGTGEVTVETDGTAIAARATYLLDCSGRAGVIARRGFRQPAAGTHTVALAGVWRARAGRGFPGVEIGHTLVASYADGWAWSVPTDAHTRYLTVMVDPARTDLTRDTTSREVYLHELAKVRPFATLMEAASCVAGPWGADASPYGARRHTGDRALLVGDAGSFIDPLSSFGVKKALASGWLAAVATHTALARPEMRTEAWAFYDRRERQVVMTARSEAARFAAEAARATDHPFWMTRAGAADDVDPETAGDADPAALARDPAVLAAFADLRRRPSLSTRPGRAVRIAPRAAVRGREIVMDDHVFLPAWPEGLRYLRNVDLVAVTRLAPSHADVGELYAAYARTLAEPPLPDFLGALAVLIARGALEVEADPVT